MTGLVMTKTKAQRGLLEPITHVRKPHCIQAETGEGWVGNQQLGTGLGRGTAWLWSENGLGWGPVTLGGPVPPAVRQRWGGELERELWGCSVYAATMATGVIEHLGRG